MNNGFSSNNRTLCVRWSVVVAMAAEAEEDLLFVALLLGDRGFDCASFLYVTLTLKEW